MTEPRFAFIRRHSTRLALSVVIAFVFWLVLRGGGLPVVPGKQELGNITWWGVTAYALLHLVLSLVRALRWRHLLAPIGAVPLRQILSVQWIGFLAIFALPFRIGEVVRPALFHNKGRVSFAAATGVMGAERIIDGLILMIVLGVSLPLGRPLSPLPDHIGHLPIPVVAVPAAAYSTLIVFIGAFCAMALFYWRRELARRLTAKVFGWISERLGAFLAGQVEKMSEGFRFLPSPRHLAPYLLETLGYWALAAFGMWLLAHGCGLVDVTFAQACAFMGVLGLGIIVPGAPGYFGAFQASVYAGLALYFTEATVLGPGSAYVFALYVLQFGMMFVQAVIGALLDREVASAVARVETPETRS